MGTGDEARYMLVMDGEVIAEYPQDLSELTFGETQQTGQYTLAEMDPWTITIKWPKRWRCKSRKRFIKLLMSWLTDTAGIMRTGAHCSCSSGDTAINSFTTGFIKWIGF